MPPHRLTRVFVRVILFFLEKVPRLLPFDTIACARSGSDRCRSPAASALPGSTSPYRGRPPLGPSESSPKRLAQTHSPCHRKPSTSTDCVAGYKTKIHARWLDNTAVDHVPDQTIPQNLCASRWLPPPARCASPVPSPRPLTPAPAQPAIVAAWFRQIRTELQSCARSPTLTLNCHGLPAQFALGQSPPRARWSGFSSPAPVLQNGPHEDDDTRCSGTTHSGKNRRHPITSQTAFFIRAFLVLAPA